MALRYLLDTNIVSDLVRHPQGSVAKRIQEHGEHAICTSIIVAAELRYGGVRSASKELVDRIDLLLSAIEVLPLEDPADRTERLADRGSGSGGGSRRGHRQPAGVLPSAPARGRELAGLNQSLP
jgi:predicted nucleic acid-binding protein